MNSALRSPLAGFALTVVAVGIVFAKSNAAPVVTIVQAQDDGGPPPGQLVRPGLFGSVLARRSRSIFVSPQWGAIEVEVTDATEIKALPR